MTTGAVVDTDVHEGRRAAGSDASGPIVSSIGRPPAAASTAACASSCAEPECDTIARTPHGLHAICTAVAPDGVVAFRTDRPIRALSAPPVDTPGGHRQPWKTNGPSRQTHNYTSDGTIQVSFFPTATPRAVTDGTARHVTRPRFLLPLSPHYRELHLRVLRPTVLFPEYTDPAW